MSSLLYNFTPKELQKLLDTSNSYSDLLKKIGLNPKGGNPKTLKKLITEYNLDETQLIINRSKLYRDCAYKSNQKTKKPIEEYLSNKNTYIHSSSLLKRLIKEGYKQNICECCGITDWMGKPLSFQLHHKNGNHHDNSLDNLQVLCPNCHTQTDNYGGKSSQRNKAEVLKKIKKEKAKLNKPIIRTMPPISREELKILLRKQPIVKTADQYGVTDNTVRKWCDKYGLPRKVSVIKTYSDEEWEQI